MLGPLGRSTFQSNRPPIRQIDRRVHSQEYWLRRGSTRLKITWVQQRQHHRAHKSARERVLSLALRACETRSQCVSLAPPTAPLKLSLLHSTVFHITQHTYKTWPQPIYCSVQELYKEADELASVSVDRYRKLRSYRVTNLFQKV